MSHRTLQITVVAGLCLPLYACGQSGHPPNDSDTLRDATNRPDDVLVDRPAGDSPPVDNPLANPPSGPPAGNPDGHCAIPAEAQPADSSSPRTVIGTGTPASCTSAAFVAAVARGGVITFNCGAVPVTLTLDQTAKVVNDASSDVVIDGGGLVTLSGGGRVRILYMNTCDQAQHWTTSHCQNQDTQRLAVQNLTFIDGNSTGESLEGGGGGAIFVRGGRLEVVNSRFFHNQCEPAGPDLGGAPSAC